MTALKGFIDRMSSRRIGTPLNTALQAGIDAFKSPDARPKARKVLVVIMDHSTGASVEEITSAARPLEAKGVKVIPVAIGNDAEPNVMTSSTPDNDNLITSPKDENPVVLGKKIMEKVLKGKYIGSSVLHRSLNARD